MKKFNKAIALFLAIVMTLGCLVGCSNSQKETTAAPTDADKTTEAPGTDAPTDAPEKDYKDTEFRIAWWGSDARHNATIALVEEFEKGFLNLKTEVEYAGYGDFFTTLSTQSTGNALPDVFQMDYSYISNYAESGLLLDLTEYVESGALDLSKANKEAIASGMIDGKLVGLVTGVNYTISTYNKEIADAAGVKLGDTPTMEEAIAAAKKVYDHCGSMIYPLEWRYFVRMYGEERWSDDGKAIAFSKDTLVKYMEFLADGVEYGYIFGAKDYDVLADMATAIGQGRIWFSMSSFSNSWASVNTGGKEMAMCAMPNIKEHGPVGFAKPNMFWCISADCENPDLAVEFLNYFVNNTTTYDICGTDRGLPISSEVADYVAKTATEDMKKVNEFAAILNNGNLAKIHAPEPAAEAEADKLIGAVLEEICYGKLARDQFEARAEQIIGQINGFLAN